MQYAKSLWSGHCNFTIEDLNAFFYTSLYKLGDPTLDLWGVLYINFVADFKAKNLSAGHCSF
jgi:hypothetical protein